MGTELNTVAFVGEMRDADRFIANDLWGESNSPNSFRTLRHRVLTSVPIPANSPN